MMNNMKIATFNLKYGTAKDVLNCWKNRKRLLTDTIKEISPDILCVQECLSFQADEIKKAMPHLDRFGFARYHGVSTERIHEYCSGESCNIFYNIDKFILEKWDTFWHSTTPDTAGSMSWDNHLPRNTTWGILKEKKSGKRIAVFNTHYHYEGTELYFDKTNNLMLEKMKEIGGALPTVLLGDFNLSPESDVHKALTGSREYPLSDVWNILDKDEETGKTFHDFTGIGFSRIDWILVSEGFEVLSAELAGKEKDGIFSSDHYAVVAGLAVK